MTQRHCKLIGMFVSITTVLFLIGLSACTQTNANGPQNHAPIKIGISLSFSGDFSSDGKLFEQGYQLWADTVNKSGGLLGRPVQLDIVSDNSDPKQVQVNYQKLITFDHVDLLFGPFSSLLTKPASDVANRYGYAFIEGAGTGPSVFTRGLHNLFCVSLSAQDYLQTFAYYLLSLPSDIRPKTVAYATEDDPFTQPQVDLAKHLLENGGVKTSSYIVYPAETTDYTPIAQQVIASGAQAVVLGTQTPDGMAFIKAFHQQHYNPQAMIESSGPDQVGEVKNTIGLKGAEGLFVPNGWWPGFKNARNQQMVADYIAKYGGSSNDVSSDVAQAYAVGQVLEHAVNKIHSIDNKRLIDELHSGDIFDTVQGPVKFDSTGQNVDAEAYLFQWQNQQLIPVYPGSVAAANPEFPKPAWPS